MSNQETSSSSAATAGKTEDNYPISSIFKQLSEYYNQANENFGESAFEEVTRVASVAFNPF